MIVLSTHILKDCGLPTVGEFKKKEDGFCPYFIKKTFDFFQNGKFLLFHLSWKSSFSTFTAKTMFYNILPC